MMKIFEISPKSKIIEPVISGENTIFMYLGPRYISFLQGGPPVGCKYITLVDWENSASERSKILDSLYSVTPYNQLSDLAKSVADRLSHPDIITVRDRAKARVDEVAESYRAKFGSSYINKAAGYSQKLVTALHIVESYDLSESPRPELARTLEKECDRKGVSLYELSKAIIQASMRAGIIRDNVDDYVRDTMEKVDAVVDRPDLEINKAEAIEAILLQAADEADDRFNEIQAEFSKELDEGSALTP
jgi:multidrug efflux pump subunit AcrB